MGPPAGCARGRDHRPRARYRAAPRRARRRGGSRPFAPRGQDRYAGRPPTPWMPVQSNRTRARRNRTSSGVTTRVQLRGMALASAAATEVPGGAAVHGPRLELAPHRSRYGESPLGCGSLPASCGANPRRTGCSRGAPSPRRRARLPPRVGSTDYGLRQGEWRRSTRCCRSCAKEGTFTDFSVRP